MALIGWLVVAVIAALGWCSAFGLVVFGSAFGKEVAVLGGFVGIAAGVLTWVSIHFMPFHFVWN